MAQQDEILKMGWQDGILPDAPSSLPRSVLFWALLAFCMPPVYGAHASRAKLLNPHLRTSCTVCSDATSNGVFEGETFVPTTKKCRYNFQKTQDIIPCLSEGWLVFLGASVTRCLVLALLQHLDVSQQDPFSTKKWFNAPSLPRCRS